MKDNTLEEAIKRLPLNELARRLAIPGEIPDRDGKNVSCFFPDRHVNGDRKPSFGFYENLTKFNCFSCGISGRGPDLISLALGMDEKDSIRHFIKLAGLQSPQPHQSIQRKKSLQLPSDLHQGTVNELIRVATLRHLNPEAIALASGMGVLRFGTVCGFPCWIVTDTSRRVAEARRMDGGFFPEIGSLGKRKAHTLLGSKKTWPVGLKPVHSLPNLFRKIALAEGGPDLLAVFHFLLEEGEWGTLPVAILGKNCSISLAALPEFQDREVKIFPHVDPDGGGMVAARKWADALAGAGVTRVSIFNIQGLRQRDGKPAEDLNDCTLLCAADQPQLKGLFS